MWYDKYLKGKFICTETYSSNWMTVGRIYKIEKGEFYIDNGRKFGNFKTVEEIYSYIGCRLEEVKNERGAKSGYEN